MSTVAGTAVAKWGESAKAGFQILPDVLFKNQQALGLSAVDLVVLTNLTLHWWYPDQKPFPRSTTIARRMGVDVRTVQRSLVRLTELGLVGREKAANAGDRAEHFDLGGLVSTLSRLALSDASYRYRTSAPAADGGTVSQDIF